MAVDYGTSMCDVKHWLGTKNYKIEKNGSIELPNTCRWSVSPTVEKTVMLKLGDYVKGSQFPHFCAVMSRLTVAEAVRLSELLGKAAKAAKECPPAEKQKLIKARKELKKILTRKKR